MITLPGPALQLLYWSTSLRFDADQKVKQEYTWREHALPGTGLDLATGLTLRVCDLQMEQTGSHHLRQCPVLFWSLQYWLLFPAGHGSNIH